MNFDSQQINFLDITVYRSGDVLSTDLFCKSTDRNPLLHEKSFHPKVIKKSLPYSQFSRIHRICSSNGDFQTQSDHLESLKTREYKSERIPEACERFSYTFQTTGLPI